MMHQDGYDDQYDFKTTNGSGQQNYQQESGSGGFDFGSVDERKFNPMGKHSGNGFMETTKQMFTNIQINIFVPKNPMIIHSSTFDIADMIEDNFDTLNRLEYFCEVMGFSTAEAILLKSIEQFNKQLEEQQIHIKFLSDLQHYYLRIAKKKNGKPNSDYPKVNLQQNIADVDFTSFCIVYMASGVIQTNSSAQNPKPVKKGIMKENQSTQGKDSLPHQQTKGYESMSLQKSNPNNSSTQLTTQADDTLDQRQQMMNANSSSQACCGSGCLIF